MKKENATKVLAAADKWWDSLTKQQQKDYIKKHPNSKYAKLGLGSGASKKITDLSIKPASKKVTMPNVKRLSSLLGMYERISKLEHQANMENDGSDKKQKKWKELDKKLGDILKMVKKEFPKVNIDLFKDGNTSAQDLIKMTMK